MPKTIVVLRRWRRDNKNVIALFPAEPHDVAGNFCVSYEHVGQHGSADYFGVMTESVPVSEDEDDVAALIRELQDRDYVLEIRQRASAIHHHQRYVAAREQIT